MNLSVPKNTPRDTHKSRKPLSPKLETQKPFRLLMHSYRFSTNLTIKISIWSKTDDTIQIKYLTGFCTILDSYMCADIKIV